MFDRVLNMSLGYLSCYAVVLKGIHGKVVYAKLIKGELDKIEGG